jgi:hypothetical protein
MSDPTPKSSRRLHIEVRIGRFALPPVESALVVGRAAPIGSVAMQKALDEMLPGAFERLEVSGDDAVEAIIVRRAHLKRIPEDRLVSFLLDNVRGLIDPAEMLRVSLDVEVATTAELEL